MSGCRSEAGRLVQILGPATEKLLSPSRVFVFGTVRTLVWAKENMIYIRGVTVDVDMIVFSWDEGEDDDIESLRERLTSWKELVKLALSLFVVLHSTSDDWQQVWSQAAVMYTQYCIMYMCATNDNKLLIIIMTSFTYRQYCYQWLSLRGQGLGLVIQGLSQGQEQDLVIQGQDLYLRGVQHAVQLWGRNQFQPNAQPRDNQKLYKSLWGFCKPQKSVWLSLLKFCDIH